MQNIIIKFTHFSKIILAGLGLVIIPIGFNGCVELDETPEGLLSPESFYSSEADFQAATVGVYRSLYGGWGNFSFNDSFVMTGGGEDVTSRPPAPNLKAYDDFNIPVNNGAHSSIWQTFYAGINNANQIIANIDKLEGNASLEVINGIEGQARFLRGLAYFYLVRWFGEIPISSVATQASAEEVGQSSVNEVYALIVEDLTRASEILPETFSDVGRATKGAAQALLAKVYVTMAGWPIEDASNYAKARDAAAGVINSGNYSLEPDFADLWKVSKLLDNNEWIFAFYGLSVNGDSGSKHHHATRPGNEGGWSDWFSEARFFNAFPDGYRKDVSFHTVFTDGTRWEDSEFGQPYIAKYRDGGAPCGAEDGSCNGTAGDFITPIIRYADVLLLYAEAANQTEGGPSALAYDYVNMVRRRANNLPVDIPNAEVDLPTGLSQTEFDAAVLAERNWELAFEQNRWFDLVRRKMVVEANKEVVPSVNETHRLLPKPGVEVERITGLEQNPGY